MARTRKQRKQRKQRKSYKRRHGGAVTVGSKDRLEQIKTSTIIKDEDAENNNYSLYFKIDTELPESEYDSLFIKNPTEDTGILRRKLIKMITFSRRTSYYITQLYVLYLRLYIWLGENAESVHPEIETIYTNKKMYMELLLNSINETAKLLSVLTQLETDSPGEVERIATLKQELYSYRDFIMKIFELIMSDLYKLVVQMRSLKQLNPRYNNDKFHSQHDNVKIDEIRTDVHSLLDENSRIIKFILGLNGLRDKAIGYAQPGSMNISIHNPYPKKTNATPGLPWSGALL